MSKHFLYLTNTLLVSMVARGKQIVTRREFAVSGAGAEEFQRYLATLRNVPTHLFTDLAEEDFRLDTVPHVGARDREAIFARRLAQLYRNSPFRYAAVMGRESEGRRDDRVLYVAVTNPEVLRPWLDALERLQVPLAGIHSAAVSSAAMLEELDLEFTHTLLVTFTPGQALRQTYFREGEFKFSRLTPLDLGEGDTVGGFIAEEVTRTWQYLDSLRHFGGDDRLEICVVVHKTDRAAIEPFLRGFAQIHYQLLDIETVATKLGLKAPPLASSAEEILVHLFLIRRGENHFAPPELRRFQTRRSARIALNACAAAVLAVGMGWGGHNLFRAFRSIDSDQALSRQVLELNREYDEIARSLPTQGVGGSTMRDAVNFYNGSIRSFPQLTDFMRELSKVLQGHPNVRLNQIVWQASDDPKAQPPIALAPPKNAPPVKAIVKTEQAPPQAPGAASADDPSPPFAGGRYEVSLVEASVVVRANDFRDAVERVNRLAEDIGKLKGFEARVVESPLETRSSFSLQGRHGGEDGTMMEPRFVLRVMRDRSAS